MSTCSRSCLSNEDLLRFFLRLWELDPTGREGLIETNITVNDELGEWDEFAIFAVDNFLAEGLLVEHHPYLDFTPLARLCKQVLSKNLDNLF